MNYLVHIDDRNRIAYFETPKVACTSIKKFMFDHYTGKPFTLAQKGDVHNRTLSPLKQIEDLPLAEMEEVFEGTYRRFCFVRNPFSRILSAYLDKIITNEWERARHLPKFDFPLDAYPSFSEFLDRLHHVSDAKRDIHYMSQERLLVWDKVDFEFVGRFENFAEDFAKVKTNLFNSDEPSDYAAFGKHHATGTNERIHKEIGADQEQAILKIYQSDFRKFNYPMALKDGLAAQTPGQPGSIFGKSLKTVANFVKGGSGSNSDAG